MSIEANHELIRDPQDLAPTLVNRQIQGDADGMAALYDPAAVLDFGSGKLAVGRDSIRSFYAALNASGRKFDLGHQRPALVSGDLALTSTRLADGRVTAEVARRQPDGSWLWVLDHPAIAKENA